MRRSSPRAPALRLATPAALLLVCGATAFAQAVTAGKSSFTPAHGTAAAAGFASNVLGEVAQSTLGQAATGAIATSPGYILETGVAWIVDAPDGVPLVTGVRQGAGTKHGGDVVSVFGFNFKAPGAGPLDVRFDGQPSPVVTILSNVEATAVTPAGMDAVTNPLAEVDVDVSNALGTHAVGRAFNYTPSLVEDLHTRVGGTLTVRFTNEPGDLLALALGKSVPGFSIVIPPWDGAFQVILNVQLLINLAPVASGVHVFSVPVPNDPNLVGGTLEFQAFAAGNLLAGEGSITNLLPITFLP